MSNFLVFALFNFFMPLAIVRIRVLGHGWPEQKSSCSFLGKLSDGPARTRREQAKTAKPPVKVNNLSFWADTHTI